MKKDNGKKLRYTLLFPEFITEMVRVMEYGNLKYEINTWLEVDDEELLNALLRHLFKLIEGEYEDKIEEGGSGASHLIHIAVNAMFLWANTKHKKKIHSNFLTMREKVNEKIKTQNV